MVSVEVDVLVQDGGGELEEGEGDWSRLCERGGSAKSKDVMFDFEGDVRQGRQDELHAESRLKI